MEKIYHTLQEFFSSIGLPLQQDTELTVHRLEGLHGEPPIKSPVFRTNYYAFLLILEGRGRYTIDNQHFELGPYTFYFTNPGHLKSFEIPERQLGYKVTFSEKFIRQYFSDDFYGVFPFLQHESTPMMQLDAGIAAELAELYEQMLREYERNSPYKQPILCSHLSVLLYKTKALLLTHKTRIAMPQRSAEITLQFKNLLNHHVGQLIRGQAGKMYSVKEMAAQLHLHPNYFSQIVKKETGKSASDWIQERLTAEAQAMLAAGKTISDVSFALGFTDAAHFAKFFKKQTGRSPGDFRRSAAL